MRNYLYFNEEEMPTGVSESLTESATEVLPEEVPTGVSESLTESATEVLPEEMPDEATQEIPHPTEATQGEDSAPFAVQEGVSEEALSADQTQGADENGEDGAMGIAGASYAPEDSVPTLGEGASVLSVRNLSKAYKKGEPILDNFSLDVAKGQIVGLLGPNGCGKTTLLKLVAGLLVPDVGTIEIAGERRSELSNRYISYLPERTYFTPGMKVTALLDYFADFYDDFDRSLAENMLYDLEIPMNARLRTLSKGMKEKVQLVLVMSRKTKLYLLDEPIGGVDPAAREYVLNTILARYNTDASVIITTHLIADVEPVLDSFAFLGYGGELLAYGKAENAREQTGKSLDELFREVFRCYRKL